MNVDEAVKLFRELDRLESVALGLSLALGEIRSDIARLAQDLGAKL